jgi:hypothetical protein
MSAGASSMTTQSRAKTQTTKAVSITRPWPWR